MKDGLCTSSRRTLLSKTQPYDLMPLEQTFEVQCQRKWYRPGDPGGKAVLRCWTEVSHGFPMVSHGFTMSFPVKNGHPGLVVTEPSVRVGTAARKVEPWSGVSLETRNLYCDDVVKAFDSYTVRFVFYKRCMMYRINISHIIYLIKSFIFGLCMSMYECRYDKHKKNALTSLQCWWPWLNATHEIHDFL